VARRELSRGRGPCGGRAGPSGRPRAILARVLARLGRIFFIWPEARRAGGASSAGRQVETDRGHAAHVHRHPRAPASSSCGTTSRRSCATRRGRAEDVVVAGVAVHDGRRCPPRRPTFAATRSGAVRAIRSESRREAEPGLRLGLRDGGEGETQGGRATIQVLLMTAASHRRVGESPAPEHRARRRRYSAGAWPTPPAP